MSGSGGSRFALRAAMEPPDAWDEVERRLREALARAESTGAAPQVVAAILEGLADVLRRQGRVAAADLRREQASHLKDFE